VSLVPNPDPQEHAHAVRLRATALLQLVHSTTNIDPASTSTSSSLRTLRTTRRTLAIDDALLDVARETEEGLLDIDVGLCADLHERDPQLVSERLALLRADGALLFPIALVADEDLVDAFAGVLLDVGEPGADI